MDGARVYRLRPRDRSASLPVTSTGLVIPTRGGGRTRPPRVAQVEMEEGTSAQAIRRLAFADTDDVDHDAITPDVRNVEHPIPTPVNERKRPIAEEFDEDPLTSNDSRNAAEVVKTRKRGTARVLPGPVSTVPAPTQTPRNAKVAKKRRIDVDLTIDIERSLLPPTPVTDGPATRRSTRIRERSTGQVTPLLPTPVLPTPERSRIRNVNKVTLPSMTPSETDGTPLTPELHINDFRPPISPETPTPSTSSRRNVSDGKNTEPESRVVVFSQQDDLPSIPRRGDSPLIYQSVDLVPIPQTLHIPSKHRQTGPEPSSPTIPVGQGDGQETPYLASPVLFDLHPQLPSSETLQAQEIPPFARRLDFSRKNEKTENQHDGLSLLATAATLPVVQPVPLRREESEVEMRLARPALGELGTQVLHPESSVREERLDTSPAPFESTVAIPMTPPTTVAKRSRDAELNGLDMNRIMRNIYMGSFIPSLDYV
jgi:hypothetical protein